MLVTVLPAIMHDRTLRLRPRREIPETLLDERAHELLIDGVRADEAVAERLGHTLVERRPQPPARLSKDLKLLLVATGQRVRAPRVQPTLAAVEVVRHHAVVDRLARAGMGERLV